MRPLLKSPRLVMKFTAGFLAACSVMASLPAFAAPLDGQKLFAERCANCHGPQGEGVAEEHAAPLIGDRSLNELSRYIDDTMPKDDADSMNADESAAVASYIYDAFYSPTAQFRNKPARIELARLTARQYRHSLADMVGDARWRKEEAGEQGLKADYPEFLKPRDGEKPANGIETLIDHVFVKPEEKPLTEEEIKEEKKNPMRARRPGQVFRASWRGAIFIPSDGEYEFIAETENGVKVFLNDPRTPLIDKSIRSGNETSYRESRYLLGGRRYHFLVEFNKSKAESSAFIKMKWRRPGQADEPIPARYLSTDRPSERLVVSSPFPPDDRSMGYERGSNVSKEWDDATTSAAFEVADWIVERRFQLAGTKEEAENKVEKLMDFSTRFVGYAFRRPLTDAEKQLYVDRQFAEAEDEVMALKRVVLLALKSPWFLYREAAMDASDPYSVAARISYTLWDSGPDETLLKAAAQNKLATREDVQLHVDRMLKDPRANAKLQLFFEQWLKLDRMGDLAKDREKFPEFTPELISDLRTSLDLFLNDVAMSDDADFRKLMSSTDLYVNGRMAAYYGYPLPADAPFQKVSMTAEPRMGVLSHPYLLAGFAYHDESSPIHRGVFIARSILGRMLKQPPVAVAPIAPDLHAGLSTRERVILQTSPETCMSCHGMINELGFSLEHFDAVGRYREKDKEKPVDARGTYLATSGSEVKFEDVRQLAGFLADGPESTAAFATQLFHFAVKQPIRAYGADRPDRLHAAFVDGKHNMRRLFGEIALTAALEVPGGESQPVAAAGGQATAP